MQTLADMIFNLSKTDFTPIISKQQGRIQKVTSKDLFFDIYALAQAFISNGFKKGDKVALFANNSPSWLPAALGINYAGLVDVPRGTDSKDAELQYILKYSNAKSLIVENETMMNRVKKFAPKKIQTIMTLTSSGSCLDDFKKTSSQVRLPSLEPDDLASIIYTSATTGNPKGVMLSHKNYISNVLALRNYLGDISEEKFLSLLPPWHAFGRGEKHLALVGQAQMFYTTPKKFLEDTKEQSPSIIVSVPRLWETIYEKLQANPKIKKINKIPLPFVKKKIIRSALDKALGGNIKYIISGGGGLPEHIDSYFLKHGVEILEGYGMTEMAPVISARTPGSKHSSLQTVGKPIPGVQVEIRDEENNKLPFNSEGIIYVTGSNLMKGYYKNPFATNMAIGPDNYLNTGDTGYIKTDGNIVINGRQKDEIALSNGENIQPKPLEDLLKSHPFISDAVVVGEHWDEKSQKLVPWKKLGALIVPNVEKIKEEYTSQIEPDKNIDFFNTVELRSFIYEHVKCVYNENSLRPFEKVYAVQCISPLQVGRELTLSYKLRRDKILKHYCSADVLELSRFLK
ncbi:MAG: AMP-binding protein [Candidatus Nanoarchaeia archaeon]